ncbi:AGMAT [Symbiodinium sp. KB8]|nr:AGMAT [Symbiodinium sp. KB8]
MQCFHVPAGLEKFGVFGGVEPFFAGRRRGLAEIYCSLRLSCWAEVEAALEQLRRILDEERHPQYPADVAHEYEVQLFSTLLDDTWPGFSGQALPKWATGAPLLVFSSCQFCELKQTVDKEIQVGSTKIEETEGILGSWKTKVKTKTEVQEHLWNWTATWRLYVTTPGSNQSFPLLSGSGGTTLKTMTTPPAKPQQPRPTAECAPTLELDMTWLARRLRAGAVDFTVNRTAPDCRTPARNKDMQAALSFFKKAHLLGDSAANILMGQLGGVLAQSEIKCECTLLGGDTPGVAKPGEVFQPVLAMFALDGATAADMDVVLSAHRRSLLAHRESQNQHLGRIADGSDVSLNPSLISLLIVVQEMASLARQLTSAVRELERMLQEQLTAAIGKTLQPVDFGTLLLFNTLRTPCAIFRTVRGEYMEFHTGELLREHFVHAAVFHQFARQQKQDPVSMGSQSVLSVVIASTVLLCSWANADDGAYVQGRLNLPFVGHTTFGKFQPGDLNGPLLRSTGAERSARPDFAVLGVPNDMGTQYRSGARMGPRGIREASTLYQFGHAEVYDADTGETYQYGDVIDVGDVDIVHTDQHLSLNRTRDAVELILRTGVTPFILGGDHATTAPVCSALSSLSKPVFLVQIDAHLDFVDERHGVRYGHGNCMRRCLEMPHISAMLQLGIRSVSSTAKSSFEDAHRMGSTILSVRKVRELGVKHVASLVPSGALVYFSIDIDGFDPSIAPGTGTPSHGGFSYYEVKDLLREIILFRASDVAGLDLVEVAPPYDPAQVTSLLAARVVFDAMGFIKLIQSLSPEQQRFAKAFRKTQLSSSLFAVAIVQIKPALEKVMSLVLGSQTLKFAAVIKRQWLLVRVASPSVQEIQLTQDLIELFVRYQVAPDLMSYEPWSSGVAEKAARVTAADKLAAVKSHVKSLWETIAASKQKQLQEKQEEVKMRNMQSCGAEDCSINAGVSWTNYANDQEMKLSGSSGRMAKKAKIQEPVNYMSRSVTLEAASPKVMKAADAPSAEQQPPAQAADSGAFDYTQLPHQLDANYLKFDSIASDEDRPSDCMDEAGGSFETLCLISSLSPVAEDAGCGEQEQPGLLGDARSRQLHGFTRVIGRLREADQRAETNKAFDLLDALSRSGAEASVLQVVIMGLIIISTILAVFETVPSLYQEHIHMFQLSEKVFTAIFTAEVLLRAASTESCRNYICAVSNQIDILATSPWYLEKILVATMPAGHRSDHLNNIAGSLRNGGGSLEASLLTTGSNTRIMDQSYTALKHIADKVRLVRVLRIAKFARHSEVLSVVVESLVESISGIWVLVAFAMDLDSESWVSMWALISATVVYAVEFRSQHLRYAEDSRQGWVRKAAMWWSMATISTVGYGDMAHGFNWASMLGGILITSIAVAVITTTFTEHYQAMKLDRIQRREDEGGPNGTPTPQSSGREAENPIVAWDLMEKDVLRHIIRLEAELLDRPLRERNTSNSMAIQMLEEQAKNLFKQGKSLTQCSRQQVMMEKMSRITEGEVAEDVCYVLLRIKINSMYAVVDEALRLLFVDPIPVALSLEPCADDMFVGADPVANLLEAMTRVPGMAWSVFLLSSADAMLGRETSQPVVQMLRNLDRNSDGLVDQQELETFSATHGLDRVSPQEFAKLDLDGDGTLSSHELSHTVVESSSVGSQQLLPQQQPPVQLSPEGLEEQFRSDLPATPSPSSFAMTQVSARDEGNAASSAAEAVVKELAVQSEAEDQAQAFSRRAIELRANATSLAKVSSQRALRAGATAGEAKARELIQQLEAMEQRAAEAEAQAAALRKRADAELQQADDFSSIANSAMKV